jgi:hypothetical protein
VTLTFRSEVRGPAFLEVPSWASPLTVLTFEYDEDVARTLYRACPAIFGWQKKALPCDLHLADADGRTVLGSITTHGEAWVDMRMAEWRRLTAGTRWLHRIKVRDDRG